jgi:hypothetical protein
MYPPDIIQNGNYSGLDFIYNPVISQPTSTSISIAPNIYNMSIAPTNYIVSYALVRVGSYGITPVYTEVQSASSPIVISSLTAGGTYIIKLTAQRTISSVLRFGSSITVEYMLPVTSKTASVANNAAVGIQELSVGKSFLKLSNSSTTKHTYSLAYKDFPNVSLVGQTSVPVVGPNGVTVQQPSYSSTQWYSFGTTLYMDEITTKPVQAAGFGFFVSDRGNTGYYILIDTTASAAKANKREVRIVRVSGSDMSEIKNSQNTVLNSLNGVYGGRAYAIDVKVKVSGSSVVIVAFINGYKITATDTFAFPSTTNTKGNPLIPITKTIALGSGAGSSYFDYVYGMTITENQYITGTSSKLNVYQGQFSNDTLSFLYSDILYNQNLSNDQLTLKAGSVEEFGTVAREIRKTKVKFDSRPAKPIKFSVGDNQYVRVLGSKLSPFGGEAYVLNNSSAYVALDDSQYSSYYAFGNTISKSGDLEYSTADVPDSKSKEPITFTTNWIQTEEDAKSLANWIKGTALNKGRIVDLNVFGNPLISVGDVINIVYPYQGLTAGTEKFIITSVRHNYSEGLETSITCRSLA